MAEPADAKPETTVHQAARDGAAGENGAASEQARESYHGEAGGTDAPDRGLGRKDPTTTGQNAPDDHHVKMR